MIGFSNETLAVLPPIAAGDEVKCRNCHEMHVVGESAPPGLLFVACPGVLGSVEPKTFLVGVNGKDIRGVPPDVSEERPAMLVCDACWERKFGDREPTRALGELREVANAEPCSVCGAQTNSGIYVLPAEGESMRREWGV